MNKDLEHITTVVAFHSFLLHLVMHPNALFRSINPFINSFIRNTLVSGTILGTWIQQKTKQNLLMEFTFQW